MNWESKITDDYKTRRNLYREPFPSAFVFLNRLENEGKDFGLWLNTDKNAHLFKENDFLAYVVLSSDARTLTLSPNPHIGIPKGRANCSHRLFPVVLRPLLEQYQCNGERFWIARKRGEYKLGSVTPDKVFNDLFDILRKIPASTDTQPNLQVL